MAEVTYSLVSAIASRLESLALDTTTLATGAHVPDALVHDTATGVPRDPRDVKAGQFRRFWLEVGAAEDASERGVSNWPNDHIRKPLPLTVAYYASKSHRLRVEALSSDDADRIVRGLKRGIGDYTGATGVQWIQVDVEDDGLDYDEESGGALRSLTVTIEYQRTY